MLAMLAPGLGQRLEFHIGWFSPDLPEIVADRVELGRSSASGPRRCCVRRSMIPSFPSRASSASSSSRSTVSAVRSSWSCTCGTTGSMPFSPYSFRDLMSTRFTRGFARVDPRFCRASGESIPRTKKSWSCRPLHRPQISSRDSPRWSVLPYSLHCQ